MGRLTGRNCLVTGAARGIGLAFAQGLVREGANVTLVDLDPSVADVAAKVNSESASPGVGRAIGVKADVTERGDIRAAVERTAKEFGSLDVMFNNAGINKPLNFMDVTEENWNLVMRVNAFSVLIGTQEAARQMIAQGKGGKVVNTCSVAGRQGYGNMAPYSASKAAVLSLTQAAARSLAQHKITVNAFAPAVVQTPLWEQLDKDLVDIGSTKEVGQAVQQFSAAILLGAAKPEDLVGTALFLASDDSNYITGQTMMVDGGRFML
ncbi:SDR family NAD(P)-dependent oxidoreductase [Bosea sp. (in: a-proteobacteria)]|uniref:SDR family NAD(P)-dependent oxidoreductase n=1 Tax=Bosea sp. (in: a-proteobacteria) TaxID=1871050 RepID=UPI00262A720F|nr:glucose 1-dehydrogenase [Bosea sp. (in: a-proteobacteria)]MCO5091264.1 glucose 1-dehydrogenase [Bosea sp. (in: a-proteobacteria)]